MKKCLNCGKETENEKFCSLSCSSSFDGELRREKTLEEYYKNPSLCLNCGKVIKVKENQRVSSAKIKKFCDSSCAGTYNNKKYPKRGTGEPKYCKNCGKSLEGNKRNQTYCSNSCCQEYKANQMFSLWKQKKVTGTTKYGLSSTIRRKLIEENNYKCSECGWGERSPYTGNVPLQVEHVDGNYKNNDPSNIKILCPNCHSLTPTYGALNLGNGRDYKN